MAVTLFAVDADGENFVSNVTSFPFTVPGGVQQDDIIEFWVTTTSSTSTTLTPSHSTGSLMASYVSGDAALQAQGWYYRVPSAIPTTITVTLAAARQGSIVWRIWRGVDTTTALDATPTVFSNASPSASIAAPSITTTTANAYVCAAIHNGSGGDNVTIPGGWTLDVDPTRRNGILVKKGVQAVAGASGSTTFSWTGGAYTGRAVMMAWRAATGGPAVPAHVYSLTRPSTPTSFYVSTRTTDATSVRVKAATDAGITTGIVYGTAGTPDADGYSRSTVTGLSPNTQYHYAVEMTDSVSGITTTAKVGAAHTLPTAGVPCASWIIGLGSCHDLGNQGGTSTAYTNMFAHNPQQVWSLGDTPYADSLSTSQSVHRGFMETQLTGVSGWKTMNSNYCLTYVKSDHDSSDNDSKTGAWTAPNRAATLQMFPQDGRPDPDGLYRYEVVGRVGIIYIDTRYFCTPSTKLGTTQMAWLKARLLEPEPVKLLVQDGVWIDNRTPDPVDDIWPFYNTERLEIANAPRVGRLYGVSGDQHAVSADDGSHNSWGGWPTVCAAPFRNNASHKTASGPSDWSNGIWPTTEGAVVNQHGMLTLLDDGTTITIQFRGYDDANVARVSMDTEFIIDDEADTLGITDSVTVAATLPRTAADTLGLTDSVTAVETMARSAADTAALTDSVAVVLATGRTASDALGLADSIALGRTGIAGDTAALTDSVATVVSAGRTAADTVGLTDSVVATIGGSATLADELGITDSVTVTEAMARAAADTLGLTDSVAVAETMPRTAADTLGLTDAASRTVAASRAPGDSVGITDVVTADLSGAGEASLSDALAITDAVSLVGTRPRAVADTVGLSDSVSITLTRAVVIADTLTLTDVAAPTSGSGVAVSDTVGLVDSLARTLSSHRAPADTVGLTDSIVLQRSGTLAVLDHVGITDTVTAVWDGYQPTPLPDVLTIEVIPLAANTLTIVEV